MRAHYILCAALITLVSAISGPGLHKGVKLDHFQIPPSFSGKGVTLYPAHHPDHNASDLAHLIPGTSRELYYSQEGLRPAIHGSKHGSLNAKFVRPTIVLDHSDHISNVNCNRGTITISFANPEAFRTAVASWPSEFNLITYHRGCGDETKGKRSHFRASHPVFDTAALEVTVFIHAIVERDSMESGKIAWGTYQSPEAEHKRINLAKGHVQLIRDDMEEASGAPTVNLNTNATALRSFFGDPLLNITNSRPAPGLDFISFNGTTPWLNMTRRSSIKHRRGKHDDETIVYDEDVNEDRRSFTEHAWDWLKSNAKSVWTAVKGLYKGVVLTARLLATAFGAEFKEAYHEDFNITEYLHSFPRPPSLFDLDPGYTIYDEGKDENDRIVIQCAKCGIHAHFNVDGALAFSIKDGIEEGHLMIKNYDPMTFDVQLGLTRKKKAAKEWKKSSKKLGPLKKEFLAVPLGPFGIPDVFTLGPQISISAAVEVSLEGQIDLLVGGTVAMAPGELKIDYTGVDNSREGLDVTFTPVFNASYSLTAKLEFGLPIAFEFGLDVLTGTFKKTVGFIEKPAIYASATLGISNGPRTCENGVQLRVGVDNTVSVQAFDKWERDLFNTALYDHGIGCVSANGFDKDDVDPDNGVIKDVIDHFKGSNTANSSVKITDVARTLATKNSVSKFEYLIIMDEEEKTILVSGTDGGIYLVKTEEAYDLSAPWQAVVGDGTVTADTFGRLISYRPISSGYQGIELVEISVQDPASMPEQNRAVALQPLYIPEARFSSKSKNTLWLLTTAPRYVLTRDKKHRSVDFAAFLVVFRETKNGLRLYGIRRSSHGPNKERPKDWHAVSLKSSQKRTSKSPK